MIGREMDGYMVERRIGEGGHRDEGEREGDVWVIGREMERREGDGRI